MESAMAHAASARGSTPSSASASQATTSASAFGGSGSLLSPSGDAGLMAMNGLVAVLRMLKLVDTASGLCLFTTQWKWHPHAHAEGIDALVQSLAQFAREIDGGDVVRVHFDSHVSRATNGNASASGTANNGSLTPTHAKAAPEDERRPSSVSDRFDPSSGPLALEMLSHNNGPIQGVLFHDRVSEATSQRLRVFVEQVVDKFLQLYRQEIDRLQPATAAHQAALTPEETAQLIAPFASFDEVFETELVMTL